MLTLLRVAAAVSVAGSVFLAGGIPVLSQELPARDMTIFGRLEKVWIGDAHVVLPAKIDTGAHTTSLGTDRIETFRRGDQDWVRFSFLTEAGTRLTLERKVVKFQLLKKKNGLGDETRPVVLLKLCVADVYRLTQVNLVDRDKFNYPVLIGRRFLFGKAIVDIARQFTSEPHCNEMKSG